MNMTNKILVALFALPLLFQVPAQAAVKTDMLVSGAWLADHLKDANLVILHVAPARTAYDANHIPGARYVPFGEIAVTKDGIANELPPVADLKAVFERAGVNDNSRVILVTDGSVLSATRAFFTLDYLGHDQTALLDGSLELWLKENRPVTKDVPVVTAGKFTPKPRPELIVAMADVQKQSTAPSAKVSLLDVRTANEFADRGHIPTALNANWTESQLTGSSALKSEAELRKLYAAAGIDPSKTVVTYCNSGMQASQSYFTLKYLGYDVKLYDGSLGEWNKAGGAIQK
jgi:thiosulfate/3-mercaptopyruvate sulfurtransferase